MESSDKAQFVTLLSSVAELYRETLSLNRLEIYWRCLQKYSLKTLGEILDLHVVHPQQGQFMPKPADIIRLLEGNGENLALLAWNKVITAIREIGTYQSIVFDDALIHQVIVDMGGWVKFGQITEKELPFAAREFERRYGVYLWQKPKSYPQKLVGIIEHANALKGCLFPPPVLYGNPSIALQVYQNARIAHNAALPKFYSIHETEPFHLLQEKQEDEKIENALSIQS